MSLRTFHQINAGQLMIELVLNLECLSIIQVQCFGPGTLRIEKEKPPLEQQPGAPVFGGLQVAVADGIKEFWWIGEIYVTATANDTAATIIVHPVAALTGG